MEPDYWCDGPEEDREFASLECRAEWDLALLARDYARRAASFFGPREADVASYEEAA